LLQRASGVLQMLELLLLLLVWLLLALLLLHCRKS
jgi:hypothetical protein